MWAFAVLLNAQTTQEWKWPEISRSDALAFYASAVKNGKLTDVVENTPTERLYALYHTISSPDPQLRRLALRFWLPFSEALIHSKRDQESAFLTKYFLDKEMDVALSSGDDESVRIVVDFFVRGGEDIPKQFPRGTCSTGQEFSAINHGYALRDYPSAHRYLMSFLDGPKLKDVYNAWRLLRQFAIPVPRDSERWRQWLRSGDREQIRLGLAVFHGTQSEAVRELGPIIEGPEPALAEWALGDFRRALTNPLDILMHRPLYPSVLRERAMDRYADRTEGQEKEDFVRYLRDPHQGVRDRAAEALRHYSSGDWSEGSLRLDFAERELRTTFWSAGGVARAMALEDLARRKVRDLPDLIKKVEKDRHPEVRSAVQRILHPETEDSGG